MRRLRLSSPVLLYDQSVKPSDVAADRFTSLAPNAHREVGCIHTVQGYDLNNNEFTETCRSLMCKKIYAIM